MLILVALIHHYEMAQAATTPPSSDPISVSASAMYMYQQGNVAGAERIFSENWGAFASVGIYQKNYLTFLLQTGQYSKIKDLKVQGSENLLLSEKAKGALKVIQSGSAGDIASLIGLSPDGLDANIALINIYLDPASPQLHKAKERLLRMERLYPEHPVVLNLKIRVNLELDNIEQVIAALSKTDQTLSETFQMIYNSIRSILEMPSVDRKLNELSRMNDYVYNPPKVFSRDSAGLIRYLHRYVISSIVEIGCDNLRPVLVFARKLLELKKTKQSIMYYVKSLIIEKQFGRAEQELESYGSELEVHEIGELKSMLKLRRDEAEMESRVREAEQRRLAEQEKKRQEQERQEQEQMYRQSLHRTDKAGTDFLGYYRIFNADQQVSADELKRRHRKKVREVAKKIQKNSSKLTQEQKDSEAMFVNKAYQILSDPRTKELYDLGIDPEKGPQMQQQHQGYRHRGGGFFDEDQINEIFQTFFGGGRRGGQQHRRTQYIFM